eukprot:EG_transcript_3580
MQPEERQLIATVVPNTTLLVGPLCNTSVVPAVQQCNQSAPLVTALGTGSSPERHVHCWGSGVEKAIVSVCTSTVPTMQSLGLTPPSGLASATVLHLLIVDRTDAVGNLLNHQPVSLVVPAAVAGNVSVLVYPGGDTVSQDLVSLGGSVTAIRGGFLLTSPHTSAFVTYQPPTATPATGTSDNGWWIGLATGLGSAVGLLLLAVPIIWLGYRWRAGRKEARMFEGGMTAPDPVPPYIRPPSAASDDGARRPVDAWPLEFVFHDGVFFRCSAPGDVDDPFIISHSDPPLKPSECRV